jgi:hypothetical protein
MTSIRESIRRLLTRSAEPPRPDYSYTIYWMKEARTWDIEFRQKALRELETLLSQPGFVANDFERRYALSLIDGSRHSGASLLALQKVLKALDKM